MSDVHMIIGDKKLPAKGGRTHDRHDPYTGKLATRAAAAHVADANAAADAAAAAFPEWSAKGPTERRMLLLKAADILQSKSDAFAETLVAETGATPPWAHFNVGLAAGMLREAASLTTQISGEVIPSDRPGSLAISVRQPVGVVLGIAPWNAPIILGTRAIATPLACGNTVVFKISEMCPRTHTMIAESIIEAGLPPGVLNVVSNAPADAAEIVNALIAHPAVKRINFTGSTRVGRLIAQEAAKYLKPVLLELGGKAPMIVLDDADLDEAVNGAIFGAFANQGQICMSTERIIVEKGIADAFVKKFAERAAKLPHGDPRGQVVLGSMVDPTATKRVEELTKEAVAKGAVLATGGKIDKTVMNATVLDKVTPQMRIYGEESFGPVVTIVRAKDAEDAVRIANDTEYGLSSSVYTKDIAKGLKIAKRIEAGMCHVNGPTVHDEAQMPFGGVKASGYGRFGGRAGIAEFTELRWITIKTEPMHYPF